MNTEPTTQLPARPPLSSSDLFGGWVDASNRLPKTGKPVLAHWAWGETGAAWITDGKWRTPTMPILQCDGDVTHWTLMPLGPNSPEEDIEEMKRFMEQNPPNALC